MAPLSTETTVQPTQVTWKFSKTLGYFVLKRGTMEVETRDDQGLEEDLECTLETKKEYLDRVGSPRIRKQPPPVKRHVAPRRSAFGQKMDKKEKASAQLIREDDLFPLQDQFYTATTDDSAYMQMFQQPLEQLGKGSYAEVFGGIYKGNNTKYAIKKNLKFKPTDRKFLSEVRGFMGVPAHPNILKFIRGWVDGEAVYLQTEICQRDLLSHSKDGLQEEEIWSILSDILKGLSHLHDSGFLHNDLKPENILLGVDGIWKLGDFGHLTVTSPDGFSAGDEGDARYLAPEVLGDMTPSKAADVFSAGMSLLEIVTCILMPSGGESRQRILNNNVLERFFRGYSKDLKGLIGLMIHRDPESRPTAKELLDHPMLQSMIQNKSGSVSRGRKSNKRSSKSARRSSISLRTARSPSASSQRSTSRRSVMRSTSRRTSSATSSRGSVYGRTGRSRSRSSKRTSSTRSSSRSSGSSGSSRSASSSRKSSRKAKKMAKKQPKQQMKVEVREDRNRSKSPKVRARSMKKSTPRRKA
ncbi:hypothetical protein CRE_09708 [Caenorhabditis remanei]|uniref:non-specific serine/threonine protein kinase n=1 Tax=Caenorhabditis remanei TaxID=31234 RepID=E3MX45_CAERE|nr:hypothetical protein CRE_09708 [Caenorhabditis remanei]